MDPSVVSQAIESIISTENLDKDYERVKHLIKLYLNLRYSVTQRGKVQDDFHREVVAQCGKRIITVPEYSISEFKAIWANANFTFKNVVGSSDHNVVEIWLEDFPISKTEN
jgi:dsRNA-specific ribonuclease